MVNKPFGHRWRPQLLDHWQKETAWFESHASEPYPAEVMRMDPALDSALQKASADMTAVGKRATQLKSRFQRAIGACHQ